LPALAYEELTWRGQVGRLRKSAAAGLAAFGLRATRLPCLGHWENTTFRAELTRSLSSRTGVHDPRRVLVRVHRPGYQTAATIRSELAWLESLGGHERLAVPQPLRTREGKCVVPVEVDGVPQARLVSVLRWLPGGIFADGRRGLEDDRLLGETVALLHEQARAWKRPATFRRRRRNASGLMGLSVGSRALEQALGRVPGRARRIVRRAFARGSEAIDAAEREGGRLLLIHADLHPGNLVRHARRIGVIDFDDCGLGSAALDIAIALHGARFRPDWEDRRRAFAEGHGRVRPLPPGLLEDLDDLFVSRSADWILWAAARAVDNPGFREKLDPWSDVIVDRLRRLGC
jgi:Ser/Thr protein kinase RdoA (MazF antagonist)